MNSKIKQAVQEAGFAFVAFFLTGFASLGWGPGAVPDLNTARAALGGLIVGAIGAAAKALLWYVSGTPTNQSGQSALNVLVWVLVIILLVLLILRLA